MSPSISELHLASAADTAKIAAALAAVLRPADVIALSGDLGAGKSTLARFLLQALGWAGDVPSPTFTLVQPYEALPVPVWHVDLYRLQHPAEADALGLFETDAALLIEWPERLGNRLPADALRLRLEGSGDAPRRLTWHAPPAWEGRWPPPFPQ
ncbi:tRNA (adenosine(37)-N6)-threonylcarbamoyltransferase complex ATPase subunit type 1 TsaE [Sandarakinorhabdus rubra]|uniref:tRNA (adenosine(37)-N6)-threonylcarbamoyltransferase complex ATPase subunit type 1 TsaE n=1 Tax=Sandarakinorhabdus rubra TaxID=2672568 RepID=UPI0013DC770A|nr:tRNA (adenosine(37)-N6)-threonylcarbamoyltransferase complex ATPase subunit type 1 TsaE [Sandarakinorhabdus rubra]